MLLRIIEPGLPPELPGDLNGVDADRLPPGLLVAGAMDRPVMRAADRLRESALEQCDPLQLALTRTASISRNTGILVGS